MRVHQVVILLFALTISEIASAAEHELVASVIVSRHGVRSPIAGHLSLANVASSAWPSWPVPSGHLTPRGAELVGLLGAYYRKYYVEQGLLAAADCPAAEKILVRADVDQRTVATAQALLDGMLPGCKVSVTSRSGAKTDPLFHPTRAGVCSLDPDKTRQAVIGRAGGSLASLDRRLRSDIRAMQSILECCRPVLCRQNGLKRSCSLADLRSAVARPDGGRVRLSGPISIGSTAAEVFLLQYAQGFPDSQVAWGRAPTAEAIRSLMPLHIVQFDLTQRAPYLAQRQGSALLATVVSILQRFAGPNRPDGPNLTILVGHDTNLSNLAGMLNLHWALPSYLPDETPPAGAMHFELVRERETGTHAVRIKYVAQTLDQMRQRVSLDLANPPATAAASIDACKVSPGGPCRWDEFIKLAEASIDRACVAQ